MLEAYRPLELLVVEGAMELEHGHEHNMLRGGRGLSGSMSTLVVAAARTETTACDEIPVRPVGAMAIDVAQPIIWICPCLEFPSYN